MDKDKQYDGPEWMGMYEAGAMLGVTRRWMIELCKDEFADSKRIGSRGKVFIPRTEVERYRDNRPRPGGKQGQRRAGLNHRRQRVKELYAQGRSPREIARELGVSYGIAYRDSKL